MLTLAPIRLRFSKPVPPLTLGGAGHRRAPALGARIAPRDVDGLSIAAADLDDLLRVDPDKWLQEIGAIADFYAALGDSLQAELQTRLTMLERRLRAA